MSRVLASICLLLASMTAAAQSPAPPASVAGIARKAAAARDANRPEAALKLYSQALRIAPRWAEGWWQAGTIHYAMDQYPQCRDAFRRFAALEPKVSAGFGFLGLCEFQTKDFPRATASLERAVTLGLPQGEQLTDVVLYHLALVHTKGGNFERALQVCSMLVKKSVADPNVAAVAGTAALRRPLFPHEVPEEDRDAVSRLGNVLLLVGTRPAEEIIAQFEALLRDYPKLPSLRYTYATFLLVNDPDKGLEQLKAELEIGPDHLPALISLAFEYLRRGEPEAALPSAERAARLAPASFAARACLGRVLLESGDQRLPDATRELEAAVRLAPDSPQARYSLASAYARAGRKQDAARERAEFARLKKLMDTAKATEAAQPPQ